MNIKWYAGELEKLDRQAQQALEMTGEAIRTDLIQQQTVPYAEDPYTAELSKLQSPNKAQRREARDRANATGVVPGELQGSIFVDRTESFKGKVAVVSNTPYARRLYFHPEYNFYRGHNKRAGGEWYRPYMDGGKRYEWVKTAFSRLLRRTRA